MHGTGVWEENGEKLYIEGIQLSELITNREDAYTYLYGKLNGKCCDNPSGQVYEIVKNLQKGIYAGKLMEQAISSVDIGICREESTGR